MERGQELEDVLGGALRALEGHELVGEVRAGIGAIAALGFTPEALAATPDLPFRVFAEVKARGVLARPLGDAVAMSPPLVITRDEIGPPPPPSARRSRPSPATCPPRPRRTSRRAPRRATARSRTGPRRRRAR